MLLGPLLVQKCCIKRLFLDASDHREVSHAVKTLPTLDCCDKAGGWRRWSSVLCTMKYVPGQGSRKKKKKSNFTTGHLRHMVGKHQAVRAVKAVSAHNPQDAMHQYVMTN